ncbi:SNF2 domain-containing protein CLASSY 3-like [Trifolium pratense]|uniref:SNF2 domain-containing protein CLASSY 3-like n=1 Tax=Trifolium pratense TaxID=57577 RepID=UPI001E692F59|nr:SNF2 domain-containing protein CLASSY 3-like [Trifolium pratense]
MAGGVSSRTRSKKVPPFHIPSFDSSSSKRRKNDEDVMSLDSASGSKRKRLKDEAFVFPQNKNAHEVIFIEEEEEEGFKKEVKIDESGGSSEIGDNKDGNFVDEKIGWDSENPIICSDESGESDDEEQSVGFYAAEEEEDDETLIIFHDSVYKDDDSDESDDDDDDDDESEENETSDEDFKVDELDEVSDDDEEKKRMTKDFDELDEVSDRQSGICHMKNEKKGSINNHEIKGCSSSNNKEESKKKKAKSVEKNVSDVSDSIEEKQKYGKRRWNNSEKQKKMENNGLNRRGKSAYFTSMDLRLAKLLSESYSHKKNSMKNDPILPEVNQCDARKPPVCVEAPLIWSLKRVQTVELTEEEEEERRKDEALKPIWDEMEMYINESEAESKIGCLWTNEASQGNNGSPSSRCEHDIIYDEQIGDYCESCGKVITESRYKTQLVIDKYPYEGYEKRASSEGSENSLHLDFSQSRVNVSDGDLDANICQKKGIIWDLIPEVRETLYPHQQEGFEFIWKNLAGNIELQKLKNADPLSEGGCIISHAPGTGKTRLTIVFLKAYLKLFPNCLPIVVAPASLLLTWEEEFKKWDIGVPFHNISNLELSGKEHADVLNRFDSTRHRPDETRIVKLISWFKETSILGISYNLYGSICQHKKEKNLESVKETKGNFDMREVLLEAPGLLVLDEGHIPRNQRSHIWKVLTKSQTQKRIILSGTPFQNNFSELYSTLSLVKPSFPTMIPPELKSFCHKKGQTSSKQWGREADSGNIERDPSDDDKIEKLKLLMEPFVHIHKGAILENKLPGLRECLVTLKADSLQNDILKSIKRSQNKVFNFERKIALASVHPSLFLKCHLSKEEESLLDKDKLKQLRMNPHEGVKTKFVYEFVRLCDASNEKVLIFSQFHAPLQLIQDQLNSAFNWSNGEVLFMSSNDSTKDKQSIIHRFNDENSKAKVLLAATKACSEGISLVGASRVVLLDVAWNPSVKRQAISRAYRIGQKKVVYTYHLLVEGTTEAEKYGKQAEKDRLSELLFSAKNATDNDVSKRCAVNFEDEVLDKMTRHEKLMDIFFNIAASLES